MAKKAEGKQPRRKRAEYIIMESPDKLDHEYWNPRRALMNIPHPFRALVAGATGSGKTTGCIVNLIAHQRPPFEEILVVSADPDADEWEALAPGCEVLEGIPTLDDLDKSGKKRLLILEDLALDHLRGDEMAALKSVMKHGSTHRGTSVIVSSQDAMTVPTYVRRQCNLFSLWSSPDLASMKVMASRVGLSAQELLQIFRDNCKTAKDYITIDLTDNSPAKLRYRLDKPLKQIGEAAIDEE